TAPGSGGQRDGQEDGDDPPQKCSTHAVAVSYVEAECHGYSFGSGPWPDAPRPVVGPGRPDPEVEPAFRFRGLGRTGVTDAEPRVIRTPIVAAVAHARGTQVSTHACCKSSKPGAAPASWGRG